MNTPAIPQGLWLAAVCLPLALALGCARGKRRERLGIWAPWAALPGLLASLWPQYAEVIRLDGVIFNVAVGLDPMGRSFLFLTSLLWFLSGWFARGYFAEGRTGRFYVFWLLTMAGNFALVLVQDMVGFYAAFAFMSFSAYGLVVHAGTAESWRAGRIYMVMVVLGEVLLSTGIVVLAETAGGINFGNLEGKGLDGVAVLLIGMGFGIKAGAVPLHVWMPFAYAAAPAPAAAVFSGAMINAGFLGWMRFLPAGSSGLGAFSGSLMLLGLIAVFFGVVAGVTQSNPKTVLAYSSISQMGLISIGLGASLLGPAAPSGMAATVILYALHHGLAKGALFLGAAMNAVASTSAQRALVRIGVLLPALALAGAPLTSGAVAKGALKAGLEVLPPAWAGWMSTMLPLAAIGTTLLMSRFIWILCIAEHGHSPRSGRGKMWIAWTLLLFAVGSAAWVWPGAEKAAAYALKPGNLWASAWPILVGMLVAWMAARPFGRMASRPWIRIPPGDLLVLIALAFVRLRRRWRTAPLPLRGARMEGLRTYLRGVAGERLAKNILEAAEERLRAWPNVGLILLLMSGALLMLLL